MAPRPKKRDPKTRKPVAKPLNGNHTEYDEECSGGGTPAHAQITEEMLERILFRWYQKYQRKKKRVDSVEADMEVTVILPSEDFLAKALSIVSKVDCVENLREKLDIAWIKRWQQLYGVAKNTLDAPPVSPRKPTETEVTVSVIASPEGSEPRARSPVVDFSSTRYDDPISDPLSTIPSAPIKPQSQPSTPFPETTPTIDDLTTDQIYYAFCFTVDIKCLPDANFQAVTENDRISVLMAANQSGSHRTRVLVTGRQWRPNCLHHVNMVTQPVVYAGGGDGVITSDLFKWWFHKEFAPAVSLLHARTVLYIKNHPFVPPINECISQSTSVTLNLIRENTNYDFNIAASEFRTIFTSMLLRNFICTKSEDSQFDVYLRNLTLKDTFILIHKAWLQIRPETFQRCWEYTIPETISRKRKLAFSSAGNDVDMQGDHNLLLELQWMAHDLGLEVADDELADWARGSFEPQLIKAEVEVDPLEAEPSTAIPNAAEAVGYLEQVLLWMETQPFDPNWLLCVQDVVTFARKASKMGLGPGTHPGAAALPFFCHNGEHLSAQPPPAHMGIPPYQLDTKAAGMGEYWRPYGASAAVSHADWKRIGPALLAASAAGLTRPPMYPFSPGQYPYPMLSPEMSQVAASWHTPSMYPISTAATGFRSPYPRSLPIPSSSLPSDFYRFSPGLMPPHPGLSPHSHPLASHPAIVTPGPKQELPHTTEHNHKYGRTSMDQKNTLSADNKNNQDGSNASDKKKPHIKKPLNAFMLYMKEMRAKVVAECTLKESAAINQILGRRWHSLSREEQAKYYEKARQERQLHMQLYPGWSARDNYGYGTKKKKRKKERTPIEAGGNSMKKCRARHGLDQQSQWCKPCRRKKKCIRYMEAGDSKDDSQSNDNLGSCGSVGDAQSSSDDDAESLTQSLSSRGGLSGLSSLTSPSMILPSPSTSLASPSVSLASPCMSLQSPLTPHDGNFDCKPLSVPASNNALSLPSHLNHQPHNHNPPHRNPVGTNPHDINNPLSVNQLTGQCVKNSNSNANVVENTPSASNEQSRLIVT